MSGNHHSGMFKKNTHMKAGFGSADKEALNTTGAEFMSRAEKNKDAFRQYISMWRACPDLFIDFITPKDSHFKLYFYQRVFLRVVMRYKYVYATFTRAYSKSFLSVLSLYLKCIFYPGIKLFISSGGKEQAANIAKDKINELWTLFPVLKDELKDWQMTKDYVKLVFKNNSQLDILGVQNSSRGMRRHSGLIEEAILIDGKLLSEVIIPTMNISRQAKCGGIDPNEQHQSQVWLTTAGYKNTFAYQKMIQYLVWMVTKDNSFVFGGDWNIPLMHNMISSTLIEDLKEDGSFEPATFAREYGSQWSGANEDAFFNGDEFTKHRTLYKAEFKPEKKNKTVSYVMAVDVARVPGKKNAQTVAVIIKWINNDGIYTKHIVNMHVIDGEHFESQSIKLKKVLFNYDCIQLVVDGNGLGVGLIDELVKKNIDEETGDIFPPLSVVNDEDGKYAMHRTNDSLPLLWILKTSHTSSDIHVNCLSQINSGRVKFLVDQFTAKGQYVADNKELANNDMELARLLHPHILTDILRNELLNLSKKTEGRNIELKRVSSRIGKDKFSALEYGLWWCKLQEDLNKRSEDVDAMDFLFFKPPSSSNSGRNSRNPRNNPRISIGW